MPKIEIDTSEIVIRSILNISEGKIGDIPNMMSTTIRNIILATARNELMIVQCKHEPSGKDMWVLCAYITDNPAMGEKLLPLCPIPAGNDWIASVRPPPDITKSAFVTPMPADDAFTMIPIESLQEAREVIHEMLAVGEEEEAADEANRQADEASLFDDAGKPKVN